jgi:hypothetical protein
MFRNRHFDQVKQLFADQFTPDGAEFIYRKSSKGAPIRVSSSEREDFIAAFNRQLRLASWGIVFGTVLLIGLLVMLAPAGPDSSIGQMGIYIGIGAIVAIFFASYQWAWNAPVRALQRRPVVGQPLSRTEIKRMMLDRITYGQLGIGVLAIGALLLKVSAKHDLFASWNRLWLLLAAIGLAGIGVQAFRKWRMD